MLEFLLKKLQNPEDIDRDEALEYLKYVTSCLVSMKKELPADVPLPDYMKWNPGDDAILFLRCCSDDVITDEDSKKAFEEALDTFVREYGFKNDPVGLISDTQGRRWILHCMKCSLQ